MIDLQAIKDVIADAGVVPDMSKFDPEKTFRENGIDSLDVMTVFLAVEEHYKLKFSEEEVNDINSASEMLEALKKKQSGT